jgi:hypothetical protein
MVDEDLIDDAILKALKKIGAAVDAKSLLECNFPQGTDDKDLVAATKPKRRILLTRNFRNINEHVYPPCGHGGIILIKHPNPTPQVVVSRVKAFCRSGKRSEAKGHVTHLNEDSFKIHKLNNEVIEGSYSR